MTIRSIIENIKRVVSSIVLDLILGTITRVISYTLIYIGNAAIAVFVIIINVTRPIVIIFSRFVTSLHHRLGSYFPSGIRRDLEQSVVHAGIKRNPEEILGIVLMYSIILPIVVFTFAIISGASATMALFTIIFPFVLAWVVLYMILLLLIDRRTASIEEILPDVLAMVSQNMIAGMTPYNALWVAARSEFGPLAIEIQAVARDTLAGASLEDSLIAMTQRIRSDKLTRSVKLLIQGMKSGGELPTVLQEIANDMRTEQNLMKRMRAETTAQAMFILFALLVGAPLLFAASLQFIIIFSTIFSKVDVSILSQQSKGGMIVLQPLLITPNFFMTYAIIVLCVSAVFGSFLIGLIRTGKITAGITLIPILTAMSVAIFLAMNYVLNSFFGGMISI